MFLLEYSNFRQGRTDMLRHSAFIQADSSLFITFISHKRGNATICAFPKFVGLFCNKKRQKRWLQKGTF
jgi:hypothetical protein